LPAPESPEEILFGMATGAVVGALNHGAHEMANKVAFFKRLREHYESGTKEDFKLTSREFAYLIRSGKINVSSSIKIGDNEYACTIDFYNSNNDLRFSFGRSTVTYYVKDGVRIYNGFYDTYDFDSKPWGTRSPINEIITRTYDSISSGSSFEIFYNQSMLFQQEGFIQNIWLRGNSIKLP